MKKEKNNVQKERSQYKQDIIKRLNRVEGQIKGIQRMIEEDKNCVDVLTQVAAVRAAVNKVGGMIMEKYTKTCLADAADEGDKEKAMKELMDTVQKFLKFVD